MVPTDRDYSAEAANPSPTHHVLDWFQFAMGVQHVARATKSWPDATETDRQAGTRLAGTIEGIRWRLWHGQVTRALDPIAETAVIVDATAGRTVPIAAAARKVASRLGDLETYVSGQSDIIINYATARRREEPISTAITERTVQWLLRRRMNAHQKMRWSPKGSFAAEITDLNRERYVRPGSCRRRAFGPAGVSASGLTTPTFWAVSDIQIRLD